MTEIIASLFWLGVLIIFYTYVGYGIVIFILAKIRRAPKVEAVKDDELPEVTLLVAAYNEEQYVESKILNTLSLDYPADKLSIVFVTDGSSDSTPDIIKQYNLKLFHEAQRKGKIHAV